MTEGQFLQRILDYAELRRWMCMHSRPARTEKGWRTAISGDPGFPDLVLARAGVVLFWEVKSDTGKTTPAQDAWLDALGRNTFHQDCERARVVRPDDWEWIMEVLK